MTSIFDHLSLYPVPLRLGFFLIILALVWLPIAVPIYLFLNRDANLVTILTMGVLLVEFLILLRFWGKYVHKQAKLSEHYGLLWQRQNSIDLLNGLSIGLLFCLGLFTIEGMLGWVEFQQPSVALIKIIAEGFLSALAVGFAEELVFRGWILDELERDYQPKVVLYANALIFALSHFLKSIEEIIRTFVTFPALIILGITLVSAKRAHGNRLGICIGLHGGLVWGYYILNVGQLITYSQRVPSWITGIDGNPIAGVMGLSFLTVLALWMLKKAEGTIDRRL